MKFKVGMYVKFNLLSSKGKVGVVAVERAKNKSTQSTGLIIRLLPQYKGWTVSPSSPPDKALRQAAEKSPNHKAGDQYWFISTGLFSYLEPVQIKFKNDVHVSGPVSLINAFIEEAKQIGWSYQSDDDSFKTTALLFNAEDEGVSLKPQHFWNTTPTIKGLYGHQYNLPEQWNEAIAAISEVQTIEEEPVIEISGYKAEVKDGKIAFGCQSFTKTQLRSYKDLLCRDAFKSTITINKTQITAEMLDTLISMLDK